MLGCFSWKTTCLVFMSQYKTSPDSAATVYVPSWSHVCNLCEKISTKQRHKNPKRQAIGVCSPHWPVHGWWLPPGQNCSVWTTSDQSWSPRHQGSSWSPSKLFWILINERQLLTIKSIEQCKASIKSIKASIYLVTVTAIPAEVEMLRVSMVNSCLSMCRSFSKM